MSLALGVSAFLAAYNNTINLLPFPPAAYVPANLGAMAALLAAARRSGLTWQELGLTRGSVRAGVRWGAAAAAALAAGLGVALALPSAAPALEDKRVSEMGLPMLLYQTLVRIPLGTALFEEVAFRGVLFGTLRRERSTRWALWGSSAVFGVWHIGPTLETLRINEIAETSIARASAVTGAVVLTGAGGALFALLRLRTGGLTGPILVHAAANSFSATAAFLHQQR